MGCHARMVGCACAPRVTNFKLGFVDLERLPVKYGEFAWLRGFEVRTSTSRR